ncbi:hypothetical protein HYALB_00010284 [Hymenoscyphus albidus]|uniref:acetylornithine transaminase n=1 Tax=Hymenoscyphus albidus TaxID=595503 RepID=A0A9N9Q8V6_9HELO|nr:hypothetical protein HYALB_00010284 [Hymenoscyphus albidus]
MVLRISAKRLTGSFRPSRFPTPVNCALQRYSSQAAAAAITPSENISDQLPPQIPLSNADPVEDSPSGAQVKEEAPYMVKTYARPPPVFVRGKGVNLWDKEDRKYLDFTAGIAVNVLGHCDDEMAAIIAEQAKTLVHTSNLYHNPWTGKLSKLLVEKTAELGGMHDASAAFICNSGTEANEAAIKFARKIGLAKSPNKRSIVSFKGAFHGRTLGALSATPNPKYQKPFGKMLPGFHSIDLNDEDAIFKMIQNSTAGVIVEPIQGEGGVNVALISFMLKLAQRCKERDVVLIYDEIQCGLGRTGSFWAHSSLPREAHPDIITTAKALGNGFPIGATIVNERVAEAINVGDHGTTFGGNPLGARVAHNIVTRLSDRGLLKEVQEKGQMFFDHFEKLREKYPHLIKESRGRGLILGLQLTQDPTPIVTAARERGLLIITAGTNTLRFVPSLNITKEEIQEGIDILDEAIRVSTTPGQGPEGEQVKGEVDSPN